ncbi:bolA-like protein 2 isoform X1 [Peromyscus californicus insignis]|uniref:bolA-like protein 2 isoform X1 n=1 Tax=Peromyscus californicus insignis TaxID=564181 RepID=UPI0022A7671E|nr:bolA-like protein 2 isoform X1 [Peromyscus californicus insignis]XP_052568545.1 bolA-like protein 2 isoform X1 [Peromyscus californicus insignis]XP_052568546.1 bolA-like protein 2 isoform X1 [Peromyscus californicus insignis]
MELSADYLREKLQRDLEAEHVEVEDTTLNRCATSFRVLVVSAKFEGKPLLQRHRDAGMTDTPHRIQFYLNPHCQAYLASTGPTDHRPTLPPTDHRPTLPLFICRSVAETLTSSSWSSGASVQLINLNSFIEGHALTQE